MREYDINKLGINQQAIKSNYT